MAVRLIEARLRVALAASRNGEYAFAREVLAGAWDDRQDLQACLKGDPNVVLKGEMFWAGQVLPRDDFRQRIEDEFIDGRTRVGPWACMTPKSWAVNGVAKLGAGYGQRYKKLSDGRWLKVEG